MRGVTQRLFALFLPRLVLVEVRQTPGFANPTQALMALSRTMAISWMTWQ